MTSHGSPTFLKHTPVSEEPLPLSRTATGRLLRTPTHPVSSNQTFPRSMNQGPKVTSPDQSASQPRRLTQEDQDAIDAEARRKAMKDLMQSWMDRLQLISLITTFFAATEAQLLGVTTPESQSDSLSASEQVANAGLAGALVVHVFAAILSFFAAFFLVRYRLREATREELKVELGNTTEPDAQKPIYSSNPHLETVGIFRRGHPPFHLLANCHALCMWLAAVGFVLALVGVMCFAWARMPHSVSIFASVCMGLCFCGGMTAVVASWRSTTL
ncbi:hypothetical protein K474DRAFT_1659284 [Panus rudis PR-1116 ss-1]|nr:hypothetical protein K474DRAFT_1659284 [Panus rudis PR-1116 ss-1]